MKTQALHNWNLSPEEALRIQKDLAQRIDLHPLQRKPRWIAGADVSFERFSDVIHAGFVVLDARDLSIVTRSAATLETPFPYIPGFLTFREAPALLKAWEKLDVEPDVVFFDGQGIAHPRRMGIASHMGLWIDKPSIGCAKSLLVGQNPPLPHEAGSFAPLTFKNEQVGYVLRTRDGVKPVYISPGHQIDLEGALQLSLLARGRYRIPEPTRQAHLWVNECRRAARSAA